MRASLLKLLPLVCVLVVCGASQQAFADAEPAEATGPLPNAARALLADVERVVLAYEDEGWFIDQHVYAELEVLLLESLCRTPSSARLAAAKTLSLKAQRDPEKLYEQAGTLNEEVKRALSLRRQHVALSRALLREEECPFWVKPDPAFEGRQTTRNKWAVHLEGGGLVELERAGSALRLGAGGNGRLLLGRGFGEKFSVNAGAELGGGAGLPDADTGRLKLRYNPAVPVVLRWHEPIWFYDLELAPVAVFETDNTKLSWGGRVGFTLGFSTLRTRDFLPWAGVALDVEHYFEGARPAFQLLRGGVRIGIRWLP